VLAIEWRTDGIGLNSVIPGPIEYTEVVARLMATDQAQGFPSRTVLVGSSTISGSKSSQPVTSVGSRR
jgi:NAD(P)-dependent dehydrogenase (short-subunit alcohol dehydrogenase family)